MNGTSDAASNGDKQAWEIIKRWGRLVLFVLTVGGALALMRSDVDTLKVVTADHDVKLDALDRRAARDDERWDHVSKSLEEIKKAMNERKR